MIPQHETAAFAEKLRTCFDRFRQVEQVHRAQYARAPETDKPTTEMLERATRRFLIDDLLRAADWDPDEPTIVTEEARARTASQERLYFDYLGLKPRTLAPVLLVEAKGFDVELPRRPRGRALNRQDMAVLLAGSIDALRQGDSSLPVIAQWADYLRDLHGYISSLDELGRETLKRAVISAGQWVIVFTEPVASFRGTGAANAAHIHCFTSMDDMLARHGELFALIHRQRLVDTLPLTLKVSEALEMIAADEIKSCYRAVLVATSASSGGRRQPYPTRSAYPGLLVRTGERWFAIVDYDGPVEEPRRTERISDFLLKLDQMGQAFEHRLATRLGRRLDPLPLSDFPGFTSERYPDLLPDALAPLPGSTAARLEARTATRKTCVTHTGEQGAPAEFIVVTGTARFYKADVQAGSDCPYHLWKLARRAKAAASQPHVGFETASFTEDGQDRHCAHADLVSLRADRCHIRAFETHLCCQTCLFAPECWSGARDRDRLPCPKDAVALQFRRIAEPAVQQ